MSRSTSPYPQQLPHAMSSPGMETFRRAGSLPFAKPQSPPALIIPNQASPSLPPIVTTSAAPSDGKMRGGVRLPNQSADSKGGGGGLLPPADPALEHLTGMAGISPIVPSADGPMIYIQPSTPISGLKDGRGVFDAAIRRAGQQQGQASQAPPQSQAPPPRVEAQQDSFNVPPPASHPLSKTVSSDQYRRQGSVPPNNWQQVFEFAKAQQSPNPHQWPQQPDAQWLNSTSHGQMRPRAKSDSYANVSANELFNRQMLQAMAAQSPAYTQQDSMSQANEENMMRNSIDAWRSTSFAGHGQQAPNLTLDPRMLPGNQDAAGVPNYLQQMQVPQDLPRSEIERDSLPALDTGASPGQSGVLNFEAGEFSPTSLAVYQQLGIIPTTASHLAGTSSAPFYQSTFNSLLQNAWPQTAGPSAQSFLSPASMQTGSRRRSFAEGSYHPAAGAGTPGYGVEFGAVSSPGQMGPGRARGISPGAGHRRAAKSEDLGRGGTGWGMGGGGTTCGLSHGS